jgi:hypothetical protein
MVRTMSVHVDRSDDSVVVALSGPDRIFGFKSKLVVPRGQITSIEVLPRKAVPPTPGTWLRHPGTHIPGLIRFGSYGTEPNREFWAVYRQADVLVIAIEGWPYRRLVLGTRDPHSDATRIGT